jgi:4-amino-4-deoxy-L-arabinose transferase-like glycosyltransferase
MQEYRLTCLTLVLLTGFALRVSYLTVDRFHADEALYAGWALSILDHDRLLLNAPVDKPPLYLYALACSFRLFGRSEVAARQTSLAASMLSVALVYRLGRRLYGPKVGLFGALFLALSPFDILFARTAFTDSLLVLCMLGALCAAGVGRWFMAGLSLGLAFATKQHALLLIPLVLATGLLQFAQARKNWPIALLAAGRTLSLIVLGFALPFGAVLAWDAARWSTRPSFWQQSAMSYGGLTWAPVSKWGERWAEWLGWTRYLVGSPLLAVLLLLGCVGLLILNWRVCPRNRQTWFDSLWIIYALAYLSSHTVLQFSVWDRYLLPLAPLTALLLARIVVRLWSARRYLGPVRFGPRIHLLVRWAQYLVGGLVLYLALISGYKAAHNGYPVGGDHWAYQGLDEIATYLQEQAPSNAVLYHHWLRWHYSYYLYGSTFELRWWESGEHMQREVLQTPQRVQYVVLPDWRNLEPDAPGLHFELLFQARRKDESVSFSLYRVYSVEGELLSRGTA